MSSDSHQLQLPSALKSLSTGTTILTISNVNSTNSNTSPKLNEKTLDDFRFYINAPERSYTELNSECQFSERMLRFMLTSSRIATSTFNFSSSPLITTGINMCVGNEKDYRFHSSNPKLLIWVLHLARSKQLDQTIKFGGLVKIKKCWSKFLKAVYTAKNLKIPLTFSFRYHCRAVDLLLADLNLKEPEDPNTSCQYQYGMKAPYCEKKVNSKEEPYKELEFEYEGSEDEDGHGNENGGEDGNGNQNAVNEPTEFLECRTKLRQTYLKDLLRLPVEEMSMDSNNLTTWSQYLPLPLMSHLWSLDISLRFMDLRKEDIYSYYTNFLKDLKKSFPDLRRIHLMAEISVDAASYEIQDKIVDELLDIFSEYRRTFNEDEENKMVARMYTYIYAHIPRNDSLPKTHWFSKLMAREPYAEVEVNPHRWIFTNKIMENGKMVFPPFMFFLQVINHNDVIRRLNGKDYIIYQ